MPEKTESFKTRLPVAAFLFRRPEKTPELMESLEKVSPPRLYLFADGPRTEKAGEAELCAETRKVAEACIRWPCEVIRQYSDKNLGLKNSIESGLDFVFQREEFAIVLEDDCVPKPEFFHFCEHAHARYSSNFKIGAVTGNCFLPAKVRMRDSYYYSRYPHCWGWATWKSRWEKYERQSNQWPGYRFLFSECTRREENYWNKIYDRLHRFDSWAYRWQAYCWRQKYLCVYPSQNLVANTGFGDEATHTRDANAIIPWERHRILEFPLRCPEKIRASMILDRAVFELAFLRMENKRNLWQKARDRILRKFCCKKLPEPQSARSATLS